MVVPDRMEGVGVGSSGWILETLLKYPAHFGISTAESMGVRGDQPLMPVILHPQATPHCGGAGQSTSCASASQPLPAWRPGAGYLQQPPAGEAGGLDLMGKGSGNPDFCFLREEELGALTLESEGRGAPDLWLLPKTYSWGSGLGNSEEGRTGTQGRERVPHSLCSPDTATPGCDHHFAVCGPAPGDGRCQPHGTGPPRPDGSAPSLRAPQPGLPAGPAGQRGRGHHGPGGPQLRR